MKSCNHRAGCQPCTRNASTCCATAVIVQLQTAIIGLLRLTDVIAERSWYTYSFLPHNMRFGWWYCLLSVGIRYVFTAIRYLLNARLLLLSTYPSGSGTLGVCFAVGLTSDRSLHLHSSTWSALVTASNVTRCGRQSNYNSNRTLHHWLQRVSLIR